MERSIHVTDLRSPIQENNPCGASCRGEFKRNRFADRLWRGTWLHIGLGNRPDVTLAVGDRHKLILVALADRAKDASFDIAREIVAL
jgi:hypothetical protein